jgi:hypothetical protein
MTEEREWWVIYKDDSRRHPQLLAKGVFRAPQYGGFVAAAKTGAIGERKLAGMYILAPAAPQRTNVIATYRLRPPDIGAVGAGTLKL